jgi:hypothetical protein
MRIPTRMSHLSFHLKCQGHLHWIQITSSFKARAKMQKRQKYVLICVMECYGLWSVLTQSVQILRSDFVQLCNTHFEALKLKRKAKDPHRKFGGIMYRWSKQPYTFRMWNEKHQRNSTNLTRYGITSNEATDFPPQFLLSAQFLGSLHSSCPKAISSFGWVCKIVQTLQAILPRHTVYSKFILIQVYVQL